IKMDQKTIQALVILLLYQNITSGASKDGQIITKGSSVTITCKPSAPGSLLMWFRAVDNKGLEFILTVNSKGEVKGRSDSISIFSEHKITENILELKSFEASRDSGMYSCASLNSNKLSFGPVTRLVGETVKATTRAPIVTTQTTSTTTTACEKNPSMSCNPIILGPLAGGCGLLLLLLIITICYCNREPHFSHFLSSVPALSTAS
uniref:Ig-like domain-containing protein n=1 Tax=Myripristis murdjan TaxID=586833 RepID=A0A667WKX2_9TELE